MCEIREGDMKKNGAMKLVPSKDLTSVVHFGIITKSIIHSNILH